MSYATRADLEARFTAQEIGRQADPDDTEVDRTVQALADAAAEIDGAIGVRYALPLPAGDWPLLRAIACDLARAELYHFAEIEAPRRAARRARKQLAGLAGGTLRLVDATGVEAPLRILPRVTPPAAGITRAEVDRY